MRRHWQMAITLSVAAAPLLAQEPSLRPLSFLQGCWETPWTRPGEPGVIEERYTAPSLNNMLGTTRWLLNGRTAGFAFTVIRADSGGVTLSPYPGGVRSHELRLTSSSGDSALFEAAGPEHPRRLLYWRDASGSLNIAADGAPGDPTPREWRLRPSACAAGPQATLAAQSPGGPAGPDRSGRVLMYVTQTLNGLWLGLAIPAAMDADGETAYGLGLLLGPSVGLLFSKAVNDARPVSLGQATTITWGGWWGLWNGIGITLMQEETEDTEVFRNSVIGLVGGTAIGTLIARNPISAGDASLAAHASFWGTWYGIVAMALIEPDDTQSEWLIVLAGGNAGLLGGALATKSVNMSAGRVWITTASGIAGLVAGLGLDILIQPDDDKAAILIPAITSFAGLAAGMAATRNYDRGRAGLNGRPSDQAALLGVRDGGLRLGVPAPVPTLVPRDDGRTRRYVPGMRLTLFEWRH